MPGSAGYQASFGELRTAFPDMKIEVVHLVASGDDVAFAYTVTGTHQGAFKGHAPSDKAFTMRGLQNSTFKDGKLVERWGSTDELGMLSQLGSA